MGGSIAVLTASSSRRRFTLPLLIAWSIFATYLGAARLVGNLFPLSVFDMYRAHAPEVVARVLAVDAAGTKHELSRLEAFACEPAPVQLRAQVEARCDVDHRPLPYVLRDQQVWLDAHLDPAGGPEAITIISRAYVLVDRPGAPAHHDCELARCTARRREALP